ncbi:transcriptional regulator NrdR [Holzapfeliella sp. He02]|uniref:Transcriptional repressor NrdR n=1 Tax=Holzapfeliella saturejae TaxID=3082953 RepID=A0ABU8SH09_9LACO
MQCPMCHQKTSRVIDSRPSDEGRAIRRRRECENCQFRFTTFERIELTPLLVVKNDGTREAFNRDKIMAGLIRAAEKRPIKSEALNKIVDRIENGIRTSGEMEVPSKKVGELVMSELSQLDDVAYIRFASVYRQFKDVSGFMTTLEEMMNKEGDE